MSERWWDAAPKVGGGSTAATSAETLEQRSERLRRPDPARERELELQVRAAQYNPDALKVAAGTMGATVGAGALGALPTVTGLLKDTAVYLGAEKATNAAREAGVPVPTWAPEAIGYARPGAAAWKLGGVPLQSLAKLSPNSKIGQIARILLFREGAPAAESVATRAAAARTIPAIESRAMTTGAASMPSRMTASASTAAVSPVSTNLTARVAAPAATKAADAAPSGYSQIMSFVKTQAKDARPGSRVWLEMNEAGQPLRVLTSDQAGAAKRAGKITTWVQKPWR